MGRNVNLAYRSQLAESHLAVVRGLVIIIAPITLILYGYLAFFVDFCWQYIVCFLAAVLAMSSWGVALYFAYKRQIDISVFFFLFAVIGVVTVTMSLVRGVTAAAVSAEIAMMIYAALFHRRFITYMAISAYASFLFAEFLWYVKLYPLKILTGSTQTIINLGFVFVIFPVIIFVLLRSLRFNNIMVDTIKQKSDSQTDIIKTAHATNEMLEEVVKQLEQVSSSFASKSNEQVAAIAEVNHSMSEVRNIAGETVSSVADTFSVAEQTRQESETSRKRNRSIEHRFKEILNLNKTAKAEFDDLVLQAEGIDEILTSNREIVGQIKILAVNAAIQGAKAGQAGKGFRVVANELKSLIESSENSLGSSRMLLEGIRNRAKQNSITVRNSTDLIQHQFDEIIASGAIIERIGDRFASTAERVERIAEASRKQQQRLDTVGNSMKLIDTAASELNVSTKILLNSVERIIDSSSTLENVLSRGDDERQSQPN